MKKTILGVFTAMAIINNVSAAEQKLPDPNREGGMPLMQALNERHSVKQFGDKAIDDQTLSDLLWAAYGVNRSGGLRTIPTAMNQKDLEIYVAKADGIWQYNAISHTLKTNRHRQHSAAVSNSGLHEKRAVGIDIYRQQRRRLSGHACGIGLSERRPLRCFQRARRRRPRLF